MDRWPAELEMDLALELVNHVSPAVADLLMEKLHAAETERKAAQEQADAAAVALIEFKAKQHASCTGARWSYTVKVGLVMISAVLLVAAPAAWLHRAMTLDLGVTDGAATALPTRVDKVCETVEPFVLSPAPMCHAALHRFGTAANTMQRHRQAISEGYARVLQESSQWIHVARELQNGGKPVLPGMKPVQLDPLAELDARIAEVEAKLAQMQRTERRERMERLETELVELEERASLLWRKRRSNEQEVQEGKASQLSPVPATSQSPTELQIPSINARAASWSKEAALNPHLEELEAHAPPALTQEEEQLLCEEAPRPALFAMELLMELQSSDASRDHTGSNSE
jgi:hypothetical protein